MNGKAPKIELLTAGQAKDVTLKIGGLVPLNLPKRFAQDFICAPKEELPDLRHFIVPPHLEWKDFYQKYFGMNLDFSGLLLPFGRGIRSIVVPKDITLDLVFSKCREYFSCSSLWWGNDLSGAITVNDRNPEETYVILARNRQEADEELKNISANKIREQGIQTITLLERLIFELKFLYETGHHLDVDNQTLCAGSRDSGGGVPDVGWFSGRLEVGCCGPARAAPALRARAVVSFSLAA